MKITVELPDNTKCAFINYVYEDGNNMVMAVTLADTENLKADTSSVRDVSRIPKTKTCGSCKKFKPCYKETGRCYAKQVTVRSDENCKGCRSYRERKCKG